MKKFVLTGDVTATVTITIEAENEQQAIDKAHDEFAGVEAFCGNGGVDKLIGVCEDNQSIDCCDTVHAWTVSYCE